MTERINSWRIYDWISPYGSPKTLLNKIIDKLKAFFAPSWFDNFLEMQLTVENVAEVGDGDGKFRSYDGVCFQNRQIVTPETISSDNEPKVQQYPSQGHGFPNDEVQSSQNHPKPGSSIDTNYSINKDKFHQSAGLGNTERMPCRSDAFLKYLMDPYGDPMSVMSIYDHYSGICNNREYRQEPARLLPSRDQLQPPIPSRRPKKVRYDYFTTLPMTRKSRENVFTLAAKKRCTKQFRNAFVLCRRKMKARLLKDKGAPDISSYSKRIWKTLEKIIPSLPSPFFKRRPKSTAASFLFRDYSEKDKKTTSPDQQVPSSELNQEKVPDESTESILSSASRSLPSTSVASSFEDNAIPPSLATSYNNDDDDNKKDNDDDDAHDDDDDDAHDDDNDADEHNDKNDDNKNNKDGDDHNANDDDADNENDDDDDNENDYYHHDKDVKSIIPSEEKDSMETSKQPLQYLSESEFPEIQLQSSRGEIPMDWCEVTPPATPMEVQPIYSSTYTLPPSVLIHETTHKQFPCESLSTPIASTLPAEWSTLPPITQQEVPYPATIHFPTPQISSVRIEDPMDCSEISPQTTVFSSTASNAIHTELSSALQTHPGPSNSFNQNANNLPFISENSNSPFNPNFPSQWNVLPATPIHLSPYSPATQFSTPHNSTFTTEDPMDCSEIAPQTTSFSNPVFSSLNTTCTALPFAAFTPPTPFNVFSQRANNVPDSSTCSSMFQSTNILSAVPMELSGVSRQAISCTRQILKAKRKTSKQPRSAANTLRGPFILSQNINISFSSSQLYSLSSPFASNLPDTRDFSPPTSQAISSSASAAIFSIVQRSRFPTTNPPVLPSGRNPFAASPLSQDIPRPQQPRVTTLPKTGRRRRSGADY